MIIGVETRDDIELFHGGVYDPRKAHEYYLKRRQLKGRQKGSQDQPTGRGPSKGISSTAGMRPSHREELLKEKAILEKRLDRLRQVLEERVKAAKRRSGVKVEEKKGPRESAQTTGGGAKGKGKPLTETQKRKKREASKKQYEKEKKLSLSQEVEHLHRQIKDIREKIEKAVEDARRQSKAHPHPQTAPKGR